MNPLYDTRTSGDDAKANQATATDKASQRWLRRCTANAITLMIVYVGVAFWAVRSNLASAIPELHLTTLLSVIGLVLLGLGLRVIRWQYYIRHMHWRLPLNHSVLAFLASLAFTTTPGKVGESIKLVLLRMRHDIPISTGMGVLVIERLGDVVAVFILAVATFSPIRGTASYLIVAAISLAAATLLVGNSRVHKSLLARMGRIKRLSAVARGMTCSLDTCRQLLRPLPFLTGIGVAVISWSCEACAFYYLARRVGIEIEPLQASSIYGAATLAGALSALPGGLGGFEVVMIVLLNRIGVVMAVAMPAIIVFRLCTLWLGTLLGVVFLLVWTLFVTPSRRAFSTSTSA